MYAAVLNYILFKYFFSLVWNILLKNVKKNMYYFKYIN